MINKVAAITVGCDKNRVDTEYMLGTLDGTEYSVVAEVESADAVVINTCCFIDAAKEETINEILQIVKRKQYSPEVKLIVVGCAVQKYGAELMQEIPEIDALLGIGQLEDLKNVLDGLNRGASGPYVAIKEKPAMKEPSSLRMWPSGPSASLKIADGCDNHCTYCVIPQIRGPYRSRSLESLVDEAKQLAAHGVKELCLVAQDVTAYGLDRYGELKLPALLRELVKVEGLQWIRLLYCYPTSITEELLEVIRQEPKICRYLDIPLQHAEDKILKTMGRKGDRQFLEEVLDKIRRSLPDIAIRSTFIVGFPGETEQQFQELLNFMQTQRFQWAGVFTYSQEPDTPAGKMSCQVPETIKEERYHRAMLLQREITLELNERRIGERVMVMVKGYSPERNCYVGRTQLQAPEVDGVVYFYSSTSLQPGDIVEVFVTDVDEYDLVGEMTG